MQTWPLDPYRPLFVQIIFRNFSALKSDRLLEAKTKKPENIDPVLNTVAGQKFHNRSDFNFAKLAADDQHPAANLRAYINGFSANAREILEYFDFNTHIERLDRSKLLFQIIEKFNKQDLHPEVVDNETMGSVFEELIRKFAEISNETAGEHFTPREVIELMVNILFNEDSASLSQPGIVRTLYDPACGTGGMLAMGEDHVRRLNKDARIEVFGQEINPESYGICKADMLIKGKEVAHIKFGNVFPMDGLPKDKFDYFLSNPPFGVEWRKVEKFVREEHETRGWDGRFGAGLPRVSDGSLLFIEHMISKFKPASQGGSRLAIIFNGSPLFTGGPGSGESEIRRWIIENDWLEAIIALPDQLFFNTGISTYLWIVTNRKPDARKKKVQLIDASPCFVKMPRSLGNKRNLIGDGREGRPKHIEEITKLYGEFCGADLRSASSRSLRLRGNTPAEQAATGRSETCPTTCGADLRSASSRRLCLREAVGCSAAKTGLQSKPQPADRRSAPQVKR